MKEITGIFACSITDTDFIGKMEEVITISGFNAMIFSKFASVIPPMDSIFCTEGGYLQKLVLPISRSSLFKSQSISVTCGETLTMCFIVFGIAISLLL